MTTTDGQSELLASGQLLAARGDTLVWVDCLSGQLGTCQIVITDLVERIDRPLELANAVDYGIATISPNETQLALSGFDADGSTAVILVDLAAGDVITVVPTATQPDWYDMSEPWSPDGNWILWRGFDASETLWAYRLGDGEAKQIAISLPGEVNDAIVRNKR